MHDLTVNAHIPMELQLFWQFFCAFQHMVTIWKPSQISPNYAAYSSSILSQEPLMLRHQTKIRTHLGTREELQIIGRDVVASAVLEIARILATTADTSVLTILLSFSDIVLLWKSGLQSSSCTPCARLIHFPRHFVALCAKLYLNNHWCYRAKQKFAHT